MLTEEQKKFIQFWEANREAEKKSIKPYIIGITIGLAISFTVYAFIFSGWYQRATMVANAKLNPTLFVFIVLIISGFMAFFYKSYKYEQQEQQYKEFKALEQKTNMQQN